MENLILSGKPLEKAEKVLIMVHGRGGSAEDILSLAGSLNVSTYALIAPQAPGNTWYPQSFMAAREANEPSLSRSLQTLSSIVKDLVDKGFTKDQIYFLGFSQGACLVLEFVAAHAARYGGVAAFTGGVIGAQLDHRKYNGNLDGTPVFIGSSDPDFHVPVVRVKETTTLLEDMGAKVTEVIYQDMGHTINDSEISHVNRLIFKDF